MQAGIAVDSRQAEGLHPIAHIGANGIAYQRAGNVFWPHHPGKVAAQAFHSAAIAAGKICAPPKQRARNGLRQPTHHLPPREVARRGEVFFIPHGVKTSWFFGGAQRASAAPGGQR